MVLLTQPVKKQSQNKIERWPYMLLLVREGVIIMILEDNIKKLEEIVKKIDSQNINIEESLALYEEAINLSKLCLNGVKEYKGKLVLLTKELENITQDGE